MKLSLDIFYFCSIHKPDANLEKIRRYCSKKNCPNLTTRPKKNKKVKFIRLTREKEKLE